MTNEDHVRNFSTSLLCIALLGCVACSEDAPSPQGAAGTSGNGSSDDLVGTFQVQVAPDAGTPTAGVASILGKVASGPSPASVQWELVREAGDCLLEKPKVPFCDPACGSDVCVADGVCQPYPTAKDAGQVRVTGVKTEDGSTDFTLLRVGGSYQPPGSVKLAFPPFEEGAPFRFEAAGAEIPAFTLDGAGIAPLVVTGDAPAIEAGEALTMTWQPAADPDASAVRVKLDISHHGGTKGMIECETRDTGSLSIDAGLVQELVDLGVAGFPTVILTRRAVSSASTSAGRVDLVVYSDLELSIGVPGVVSCTDHEDCASGTCLPDLTCE
jgi:hypothetical protein